jgi:hypothetical protein
MIASGATSSGPPTEQLVIFLAPMEKAKVVSINKSITGSILSVEIEIDNPAVLQKSEISVIVPSEEREVYRLLTTLRLNGTETIMTSGGDLTSRQFISLVDPSAPLKHRHWDTALDRPMEYEELLYLRINPLRETLSVAGRGSDSWIAKVTAPEHRHLFFSAFNLYKPQTFAVAPRTTEPTILELMVPSNVSGRFKEQFLRSPSPESVLVVL